MVSIAHVSAPSFQKLRGCPCWAATGALNPAMSLICVTNCFGVNSKAARFADGTQIRVGANRGDRLKLQFIQRDQCNGNRQEEKFISRNVEPYQEKGNVLAIISH